MPEMAERGDNEYIENLMGQDGICVEDAISNMGIDCNYLGGGIWLIKGAQYNANDVRELLKKQKNGTKHA